MRIVVKVLLAVVGLLVLVFGAWTLFTLNYTYSSGERAGYIQKISLKGWICKTWEGELAMANLPGAMPQISPSRCATMRSPTRSSSWPASALAYEQHPGIPTSCFGETEYFVVRVTPVADAAAPAAAPPVPAPPPSQ